MVLLLRPCQLAELGSLVPAWNWGVVKTLIVNLWRLAGIYLIWIGMHYCAAWLYSYWCTPWGIVGFLVTPFLVASPHCYAFRWCIVHGAETITAMWVVLGTWLVTRLVSGGGN